MSISLVQFYTGHITTLTPSSFFTAAAGNLITLQLSYYQSGNTTVVAPPTDSNGTFIACPSPTAVTNFSDLMGVYQYYIKNCNAGTHTIGNVFTGSPDAYYAVAEWAGADTTTPFVSTQAAFGGTVTDTTNSRSTGTPTTSTSPGDLVLLTFAQGCNTGVTNAGFQDPVSGYTHMAANQNTTTSVGAVQCYKIATSSGAPSETITWTDPSTTCSQATIAFFKAAGGLSIAPRAQAHYRRRRNI